MKHIAKCKGVCSDLVVFELIDGKIHDLTHYGGDPCPGNSKAIGLLVEGQDAAKIAEILEGNTCSRNPTSCADQISKALKRALEAEAAGTALAEGDPTGKISNKEM